MSSHLILVVEDNSVTRKMVRITMESAGHRVVEAGNRREALDALAEGDVSLVILDLVLPDIDGIELAGWIRNSAAGSDVPILAFSGLQSRMDQARAQRAPFSDYLFKPINPSRLLEVVSVQLGLVASDNPTVGDGQLLLLVDDDSAQLKLNALQLRQHGFEVVTAPDASRALALCHARRPDIIVTDLVMPGMTGFELCSAVRSSRELASVPVVVASSTYSYIDTEDEQLARMMGANTFVLRTPALTEVIAAVRDHIGRPAPAPTADAATAGKEYVHRLIHQLERQGTMNATLLRRGAMDSTLLSILTSTAQALSQRRDLRSVLQDALSRVLDASGLSSGAIFLSDEEGELKAEAVLGGVEIQTECLARFFGATHLLEELTRRGGPVRMRAEAIAAAVDHADNVPENAWLVIAPIIWSGRSIGALVTCSTNAEMSEEWLGAAHAVANQLAVAIALADSVTRLVESEAALRERNERFNDLADSISEVFYLMDADAKEVLFINPAYEKMWGRSTKELYQHPKSFFDAVDIEDRAAVRSYVERVRAGESPRAIQFRIVRPDGQRRWIHASATPIRDAAGNVYRISGVARDVTDEQLGRLAVEESEARFRLLAETTFDGIAISQHGRLLDVNAGMLRIFGYEHASQVLGRSVLEFIGEESAEEAASRMVAPEDGRYELIAKRADGSKINVEITVRGHVIAGAPARITALRDITERRLLEDQYRQAQKMEAVGRLAGGVAHDFNNMLTVITGNTELLLAELIPDDPRAQELQEVRQAADSAATLTRQLLAFSRQQVVDPKTVALRDVIGGAQKLLKRLIGEDINLSSVHTDEPCLVYIDPGQLEQVVMNLAVNARDAMPTGGKLTVETSIVDVDASSAGTHWPAAEGRYALLAVSDTGCGMSAEVQKRVFEPFFTTKEPGKGTGLGLATVYGVIKQAGGFLGVYSEVGVGTTMKVYLPLAGDAAVPEIDKADLQPTPAGSETILLVEDSQHVREVVHRILERNGYHVIDAGGPQEALALIGDAAPDIDLLLTDVVMPHMSGRILADRFAEMYPDGRILYMSGYTDDAIVRHGVLNAGMPYLQKPFSPHKLATRIREVLDGRQAMATG